MSITIFLSQYSYNDFVYYVFPIKFWYSGTSTFIRKLILYGIDKLCGMITLDVMLLTVVCTRIYFTENFHYSFIHIHIY